MDNNKEFRLVDLFPYKIKNRESFYHRGHPENIRPDSPEYKKYWVRQLRRIVEGHWVDDEGTWVFMMPKLYYYVNIAKISDTSEDNKSARMLISPRLRDNEWIIFTYILCAQGFSGFELDSDYTCHETIEKLEKGEEVNRFELTELPSNVYKEDGTYKKFVNAWDYLTRHYLIDNPAEQPLGRPHYDNPLRNSLIFSSRGIGKSLTCFVGDLTHEFLTGGIHRWENIGRLMESPLLFFAGSSDEKKMNKTLRMIKTSYDNLPGSYSSINAKGEEEFHPSPFYRKLTGSWKLGSSLIHQYKKRDGRDVGSKSMIELNSIHSHDVATGDRYSLVMVEEWGLLKIMMQFYNSTYDSLEVNGVKTGRLSALGTGGDVERIQESKIMFTQPEGYKVYSMPNYWENPLRRIGLFIPVQYKSERYKDPQGNTDLKLAHEEEYKYAEKLRKHSSAKSYKSYILNNPFIPSQIFQSTTYSVFPAEEAKNRLVEIETNDLWRKKAAVGSLLYSKNARYGVKFDPDLTGKLKPINKYLGFDIEKEDTEGALVIYEQPPDVIPKGLYKVVYDPVAKDGEGTSLNSVLVYKGFNKGDNRGMSNNIVAEWIGRLEKLSDTYELVYKIAMYFNAKVFPETNTPGFVGWMRHTKKQGHMLQPHASYIEKEIFKNYKHDRSKVGFSVRGNRGQMTFYLDQMASDWLLEDAEWDDETGHTTAKVVDTIYSTRLLEELAYYDEDNFDHISSLRGLMLWLANDRKSTVYDVDDTEPIDNGKFEDKEQEFFEFRVSKPGILNY